MPRQPKNITTSISEKNTKSEIIDAYQQLISQIDEKPEEEQVNEEKLIVDKATIETVEKIVGDLSQLGYF